MIFGLIGYVLKRLDISIHSFVIGFLFSPLLEELTQSEYSESGGDTISIVKSSIALSFLVASVFIIYFATRHAKPT